MTTLFVALVVFDYINARANQGNGELTLDHFLYYYQAVRSWGNNRPHQSPKKLKGKSHKGKDKVEQATPIDSEYYKKWLIRHIEGTLVVFDSPNNNKIKTYDEVEVGGKYCSEGCSLLRRKINLAGML